MSIRVHTAILLSMRTRSSNPDDRDRLAKALCEDRLEDPIERRNVALENSIAHLFKLKRHHRVKWLARVRRIRELTTSVKEEVNELRQ